jgi:hypothetical protein
MPLLEALPCELLARPDALKRPLAERAPVLAVEIL